MRVTDLALVIERDCGEQIAKQVRRAARDRMPLQIVGGGSKSFYGRTCDGAELSTREHRGIINYEPNELVLTARSGTPLREIESALSDNGQMLAFEPPHFGADATLGGTTACNFSGPRRPFAGAARDFVLGATIVNGHGEILRFGGQVMKNVAGYDVSRLFAGSLGTLGVILDVSLKILPVAAQTTTLVVQCNADRAIEQMNRWAASPLPITATCYDGDSLHVRLEGAATAVAKSKSQIGGDEIDGAEFWRKLREHQHDFFLADKPLWRIAVAPATPQLPITGQYLLEWNGAQRWYIAEVPATEIRRVASEAGGHATLFRRSDPRSEVFHPLASGIQQLHLQLKSAFDPHGIFNRGKMYAEF